MSYRGIPRSALAVSLVLSLVACGVVDDVKDLLEDEAEEEVEETVKEEVDMAIDDATGTPETETSWPIDPATARTNSGWGAPDDTDDDVRPALQQLTASANTLLISDVLFTAGSTAIRGQTTCGGDACTVNAPALNISGTLDLQNLGWNEDPDDEFQAIATHRDITLAQGRGSSEPLGVPLQRYGFGGWMEHNYFIVESSTANLPPVGDVAVHYSTSVGNATGTNPTAGGATWSGVVVGMDVRNSVTPPHAVQGEASISIADFASPAADISFSGIHAVVTGATYDDMDWTGIPIANGAFEQGADTDSISGHFYGPNHEEVGGIFERDMIVGAFGAARE